MSALTHRIRSQRWLVRAGSQAAAFRLRQRLRDESQSLLLSALEKVFDAEFSEDEVTHLPRINLDLGCVTEEQLRELPTLIHGQLLEQLGCVADAATPTDGQPMVGKKWSSRSNRLFTLFYYLRTGSLPWEAIRPNDKVSEVTRGMKETCCEQWEEVQQLLRREQWPMPSYFRLLHLLGPAETHRLALLLDDNTSAKPTLKELLTALLELCQEASAAYGYLELTAWVLSVTINLSVNRATHDVLASIVNDNGHVQELAASLPRRARGLLYSVAKLSGRPPEARANADARPLTLDRSEIEADAKKSEPGLKRSPPVRAAKDGVSGDELIAVASEPAESSSNSNLVDAAPKRPWSSSNSKLVEADSKAAYTPSEVKFAGVAPEAAITSTPNMPEELARMVTHAGLVLLHPFLPQFFEATGIRTKDALQLSWPALPRAAAMLYYLATGQEEIYEYDIAFIKVLLDIEPETALCVSQGLLTSDDRWEADSLVTAAIRHWQVLKNTSVGVLRSSFMQRAALLRKDDNGWRLQVERQSFDVVLEHLPWSIAVVKLPWMKCPLYTEW